MNNLTLSEDAAKFRREYHQDWRKKNKERVREYNSQYWERKVLKKIQSAESGDKTNNIANNESGD